MEYKVIDVRNVYEASNLEIEIEQNSSIGWELVSVVPRSMEDSYYLVYKKAY